MSWQGSEDFLSRLQSRLIATEDEPNAPIGGDWSFVGDQAAPLRDAAVLFGVVRRENELNVVLTMRPKTMAKHPGQVAFPGGKLDEVDKTPIHAALREAEEEIGVAQNTVSVQGVADRFVTGTGFRITPVVGLLPDDFVAVPDPYEVEHVFETPVSFLMNTDNHQVRSVEWEGKARTYLEIEHNGHRIWGVTAGLIRALHDRLYGEEIV